MIELLILIIGLFASYLFIISVYQNQTLMKLIVSMVAMFMSFLILLGYYLDRFGMPIFSAYTLIIFLFIAGAILLKDRQLLRPDIEIDRKFELGFIFILTVGFIVYILPSIPSLFPVARIGDSAMHYAISTFITEHNSLMFSGSPYTLFPQWDQYPFGLHLNVAFVSMVLNKYPIVVLYPFMVIISVLNAAVLYGLVVESKISGRLFGLLPPFVALSFYLSMDMVRVQATWAMAFGIFLVLMFIWLIMDYIKNPDIKGLIPLALIEIAIIFSYPYWAAIPIATLLFVLLWKKGIDLSTKDRLVHISLFSLVVGVFTIDYAILIVTLAKNVIGLGDYNISFVRFLPFDIFGWRIEEPNPFIIDMINNVMTIFFILAIVSAVKSAVDRKNKLMAYFFAAALLQTLILGLCVLFLDFRVYPYSKAYYLLTYPAAIFLLIGLKDIALYLNISPIIKNSTVLKASFLMILLGFVIISGQLVSMGVKMTGNQELAMSPDQYDVALWAKDNLPEGPLTYLGATPQDLWFYVVSGHEPTDPIMVLGPPLDEYFEKWYRTAEVRDVVVLLDINRINNVSTDNFEVLYKRGNAVALKKIDKNVEPVI